MANYLIRSGTADETVQVPSGRAVKRYSCVASVGTPGTIIITPQGGSALDTITVPAGLSFEDELTTDTNDLDKLVELPGGSTIAFANMASWFVRFSS